MPDITRRASRDPAAFSTIERIDSRPLHDAKHRLKVAGKCHCHRPPSVATSPGLISRSDHQINARCGVRPANACGHGERLEMAAHR